MPQYALAVGFDRGYPGKKAILDRDLAEMTE
jgi:hypothetical protein